MCLQRQPVVHAPAGRADERRLAVIVAELGIVKPDKSAFEGIGEQAGSQKLAAGVERHARDGLPPQLVGDCDGDLAGAGDDRQATDFERPGGDRLAELADAIDQNIDRGRHQRRSCQLGQGKGHQIRPQSEIRGDLKAAETHRPGRAESAGDQIAGLPAPHPVRLGIGPARLQPDRRSLPLGWGKQAIGGGRRRPVAAEDARIDLPTARNCALRLGSQYGVIQHHPRHRRRDLRIRPEIARTIDLLRAQGRVRRLDHHRLGAFIDRGLDPRQGIDRKRLLGVGLALTDPKAEIGQLGRRGVEHAIAVGEVAENSGGASVQDHFKHQWAFVRPRDRANQTCSQG